MQAFIKKSIFGKTVLKVTFQTSLLSFQWLKDTDHRVLPLQLKSCFTDLGTHRWIKKKTPENATGPGSLNITDQEQLADLTSNASLKVQFKETSLPEFWISVGHE